MWKEARFRHKKPKKYGYRDWANSGCVVSGSLALVLRVSRAVGMSPLSAARAGAGWRVAPSSTLAVLQRLLMTVCNIMALAGLSWDLCLEAPNRVRAGESTLTTVVWTCDLALVMLIASIAIYMGPSRMESLLQVLKELQQINFDFKINPPTVKAEAVRSSVIVCLLVWATVLQIADVYNLTLTAYKDDKMWPIMFLSISFNYATVLEVLVALQWYYAASGARAAAAALNRQLGRLRDAEVSAARAQATLRRLAVSYDRIGEVVTQLNARNGLILLLMNMSNTFRLVLSPYYLLLSIFDDDNVVASVVLLQGNWIAFHIIKLLLVVEPCHGTQEEREHTELLLSQLTVDLAPKSESVSKELDQFAMQVILNRAQFKPLGIFSLSRPLILTILSSVTTYLIIMIQFQKISTYL